ncbi:MAG TPA: hypothetical protein VMQ76_05580 [Terracidiphilus sp.]|nr:hypothetical protein [Terracidiphilus sp.]
MNTLLYPPPVVWPLTFLLIVLVFMRQASEEVRPIVRGVVTGIAKNATSNASAYAIAFAFGLSASISAFIDVFKDLTSAALGGLSWHQYAVMWAKVLNPFVVAILAYATQNGFKPQQSPLPTGPAPATTTTPIPPPTNPPTP